MQTPMMNLRLSQLLMMLIQACKKQTHIQAAWFAQRNIAGVKGIANWFVLKDRNEAPETEQNAAM